MDKRPDPIVSRAVKYLGRNAFQGLGGGGTGTHRSRSPVPGGAAQRGPGRPAGGG